MDWGALGNCLLRLAQGPALHVASIEEHDIIRKREVGDSELLAVLMVAESRLRSFFFFIMRDTNYIQHTNSKGDSGSPWLRPLLPGKCPCMVLFTLIEYVVDVTHSIIQFTNLSGNPSSVKAYLKKSQDIVSYALAKSTFKQHLRVSLLTLYEPLVQDQLNT